MTDTFRRLVHLPPRSPRHRPIVRPPGPGYIDATRCAHCGRRSAKAWWDFQLRVCSECDQSFGRCTCAPLPGWNPAVPP